MRRVIIESPYAGDVAENLRYLRACMRDCLLRGETPYASHALYTQEGVLDDLDLEERNLGINAGFEWRAAAEATVVYLDRGWSSGMRRGIEHAERIGHPIELRSLPGWSVEGAVAHAKVYAPLPGAERKEHCPHRLAGAEVPTHLPCDRGDLSRDGDMRGRCRYCGNRTEDGGDACGDPYCNVPSR
jgi:hypothetical protein